MSITTYEFLSVLQTQDNNVEASSGKNSFDYMTVLNSVRSTIAQNHAAELAAALNDIKAAQTLKNLVLKYAAECMAGKDYDRDALVERIYQDNHAPDFKSSASWLGNGSTESEIRDSGMWLKQGLDAPPITADELQFVRDQIENVSNAIPVNMQRKQNEPGSVMYKKTSALDIRSFIWNLLDQSRQRGEQTCVLISGDIHREMGLANKMPSVCNAMYKLMRPGDTVLHTTPSGHSSTIKIEYHL